MTYEEAYRKQKHLWEEAEADLAKAYDFLVSLWKETGNKKIEKFFEKSGGIMIDGTFMFKETGNKKIEEFFEKSVIDGTFMFNEEKRNGK